MYDNGRFFAVTGRKLLRVPPTMNDGQQALDRLHARLWAGDPTGHASASEAEPPLAAALRYLEAGLSVIPIKRDGSKAPPVRWDPYKDRLPTKDEVLAWFSGERSPGVGIVGGMVSGNLLVLDFEFLDLFEEWCALVETARPGLVARLPVVETPGKCDTMRGRHVYARSSGPSVPSNKLARITKAEAERRTGDTGRTTAIEVKAEKGYVLAPGCPADCHETGRLYEHVAGPPIEETPTLTEDEVELLLGCARALERGDKASADREPAPAGGDNNNRPGDDFNRRANWADVLPGGWKKVRENGEVIYLCRPGKDEGVSATIGYCRSARAGPKLYVFSTNAEPFEAERSYSKFEAYTLLNHGGDFKAAARDLAGKGYGASGPLRQARDAAEEARAAGEELKRLPDVLASDGGAAALFADKKLLEALACLADADPAAYAAQRATLKGKVILRDLDRAVKQYRRQTPAAAGGAAPMYFENDGCIYRVTMTRDGPVQVALCNFTARIVEDVVHDDGAEQTRRLAVQGTLAGGVPLPRIEVPAADFPGMGWVVPAWGTRAVVYAGLGTKDHLRTALQLLSGDVPRRTVYAHMGWRQSGADWVYLHAGGALGANGPGAGFELSLPDALASFELPAPPADERLRAAIRASLGLLDGLATDRIIFPLLAAVYRAVLGPADYTEHLAGPTGVFKTELSALAEQHWGAGLDARHLPGSWASTGNSLEGLAFAAKDALLVVDDFAPHGSTFDVQRYHKEADRLLRAQGNRAGRGRCRADGSVRPPRPPRGTILSTGEDVPRGQSLGARLFVIEIGPEDVNKERLTACQADAAAGLDAEAMAGFIRWLAPRYGELQACLPGEAAELRERASSGGLHARTPGIVADLALGLNTFLDFALAVEAITEAERDALAKRGWEALREAAAAQADHNAAAEPTAHFLRLLRAALASGRAHVADAHGREPNDPAAWGWRGRDYVAGPTRETALEQTAWTSQGRRIGWIDGADLYLEPEASFAAAQELARDQGEALAVSARTLAKRLREKGRLASWDEKRQRNTVRRTLEGSVSREVLHLHAVALSPAEPSKPAKPTTGIFGRR
jgi:hypothetical protein